MEIIKEKTELEIKVDNEKYIKIWSAKGRKGFGVYIVTFSDLDIEEMVFIVNSLEEFFVFEIGVDVFNGVW